MMEIDFAAVERRRRELKIPISAICRHAEVSERAYYYALNGRHGLRRDRVVRLASSLEAELSKDKQRVAWCVQALMNLIAKEFGVDPALVREQKPGRRATRQEEWMVAADIRAAAYWFANGQLGLGFSEIATAIGISRQTIHAAVQRFEDMEDERASTLRDKLEAMMRNVDALLWSGRKPREIPC